MFRRDWRHGGASPRENRDLAFSHRVDDPGAVDAMSVPRLLPEERRRGVVRPDGDEPIIAANAPAAVRSVPLEAAADIAGQERISTVEAQAGSLEHRQAAEP